jgi:hypothetical protein
MDSLRTDRIRRMHNAVITSSPGEYLSHPGLCNIIIVRSSTRLLDDLAQVFADDTRVSFHLHAHQCRERDAIHQRYETLLFIPIEPVIGEPQTHEIGETHTHEHVGNPLNPSRRRPVTAVLRC